MRLDMSGVAVSPRRHLAPLVASLLLLLPLVSAADTKTAVACQALIGAQPNFCCFDEYTTLDDAVANASLTGNLAGFSQATHELADEPKTIKCYQSDAADATKVDATDMNVVKDKIGQCEAKMEMKKGTDGAYATLFTFGKATSKDCQVVSLDTGKPDAASLAKLTSSLGGAPDCQFAAATGDPNTHTYTCTCVPQDATPCISPDDLVAKLKLHKDTTASLTDKAVIDGVLDPATDVKLTVDGDEKTMIAAAAKFKCTANGDKPNFCCLDDLKASNSAPAATPLTDAAGTPFSTLTKVEDNAASVKCYEAALAELSPSFDIVNAQATKEAKKYIKCTLEMVLKADSAGKHVIDKMSFGHEATDCDDSSATLAATVDALQKEWTEDAGSSARCSYNDASKKLTCSCANTDHNKPCNDPEQLRKILKHAAEEPSQTSALTDYITQVLDVKAGSEVKAKINGVDSVLIKEEKYTCKASSFCCSADMFEKIFYKANNHLTAPRTSLTLDVYKNGWNAAVTDQAKKVTCYAATAAKIEDLDIIKTQSSQKISEKKYATCTITLKFKEQTGDTNTKDYLVSDIAFGQGIDADCKQPILPSESELTCAPAAASDLELVCSCVNEEVDTPCNDPKKIRAAVVSALASGSLPEKLLIGAKSLVSGGKTFAVKVAGVDATLFESQEIYKKMGLETGRAAGNIHPLRRAMQPKDIVNTYTLMPGTYIQFRTTGACPVQVTNEDCHRAYACVYTSETGKWKDLCSDGKTDILPVTTQPTPINVAANEKLVLLSVGSTCHVKVVDCLEERHAWLRFDTNGNTSTALYPKWPRFDNSPLHADTKSLIALSTGGKVNFDGRATGSDHIRSPAKNVECAKGCKDSRRIYSYIESTNNKFYIKYTIKSTCEWMYVCFKPQEDTMNLERGTAVEARKLSECAKGHSMEMMFKQKLIIMPGHDSAMRFDALTSLDSEIKIEYKGHYEVTSLSRDVFATSQRKGYQAKKHGKGVYTITSKKDCIVKYSTAYTKGSSWYNALSVMNGDQAPGTEESLPQPEITDSFNSLNPNTDLKIQDEDEDTGAVQGADDGEYVTQAAPTEAPTVMVVVNKETEAPKIDRSQDGTDNRNSMISNDALLLWGAFIGFCSGMLIGLLVASFLFYVCRRSFYKDWYRSMYSRYGSSATTASPTETGAGGTVAGLAGNSTMGGTSMMGSTMGGTTSGGTTAGGDSTMGGTTAT